MSRRTVIVGSVAALALAGATMTALAVVGPGQHRSPVAGPMVRGPVATQSCAVPALPGSRVDVVVADMGGAMMGGYPHRMMLRAAPQVVAPGTVSLVAVNRGWRAHELVVLPLAPGAPVGARAVGADGTVDETGSLGEASRACGAGAGDGITPGTASWVTLTLPAGRYELLCNLPGHYAAGMYAELDVR